MLLVIASQREGSQARNQPVKVGGSWPCFTTTTGVCLSRPLGSLSMYCLATKKTGINVSLSIQYQKIKHQKFYKIKPDLTDSVLSTSLASFPIQTNTYNRYVCSCTNYPTSTPCMKHEVLTPNNCSCYYLAATF